jgi:hypothetical protein
VFKRFVARLLIVLQIYNNLFQVVAHGVDLADYYPIRDEIHLHSFINDDGERYIAFGTNRLDDAEHPQIFETVHIPKYLSFKSKYVESEIEDDEVNEEDLHSEVSTDDEFESESGITCAPKLTYFTVQGLTISVDNTGSMKVEGIARQNSKPIFLSNEQSIILDNLQTSSLKLYSPEIINYGISRIECLRLGNLDGESQNFINNGDLSAKELFLNNLVSENFGTITALQFGIYGEVEHNGAIEAEKLFLTEGAVLNLNSGTDANIKTLSLDKSSHLINDGGTLNLDVLHSLDGNLTNAGVIAITQLAENSSFEAITNRHLLAFDRGKIVTNTFKNVGTVDTKFTAKQIKTNHGANSGLLTTNSLEVTKEFTNKGVIAAQTIAGTGEFTNLGMIESKDHLKLEVQKLNNKNQIKAKSIISEPGLQRLENQNDASIIADEALTFADNSRVINQGLLKALGLTLNGGLTTQEGQIQVNTLEITGGGDFENSGDIDVEQGLALNLNNLINKGSISTKVVNGYKNLVTLKNDSSSQFKVRDGTLEFAPNTVITNGGTIEAKDLKISTDKTTNQGNLEAATITLTGDKPFTNAGSIIAKNKLSLNLTRLTNQKTIKAPALDISKLLELANVKGATIDTNSDLTFTKAVINDGTIRAGALEFKGGSLTQRGIIEGKSLKTTNKTIVTTTDSQTMNLSGELQSDTNWSIRGQVNAQKFARVGDLDLYGTLNLNDSFTGSGTVHKGGKLTAKTIDFYNDAKIDGELLADTLNAKSTLNLNGKALVKKQATVGGHLKVGKDGALRGVKGSQLSLTLNSGAEIAGIVDADHLEADKELILTSSGKLIALKKSQLKSDIKIAKGGAANLTGLTIAGTIHNDGEFKATQGTSSSRLINRGVAEIEADSSTYGQGKDLKLWLRNEKSGQLTLTRGDFDMRGDNPFENAGILIDNSRWMWLGKPKNTGVWHSPSCSLKNYDGLDMGDFRVDGVLTIEALVDALKALEGLQKTKAKSVTITAPEITNKPTTATSPTITKKYPWPLELKIEGDINNSFNIHAPKLYITSRNLKTTGDLFGVSDALELVIKNLIDITSKVGGNTLAKIKGRHLKFFGKANIPGATTGNLFYKRNDNGIYSNCEIILEADDLIENTYGTIQGSRFKINSPRLINLAGMIRATDPKLDNTIDVKDIQNIRDDQQVWNILGCKGDHPEQYTTMENVLVWKDVTERRQVNVWQVFPESKIVSEWQNFNTRQSVYETHHVTKWRSIKLINCYCKGLKGYAETSDEGVIITHGDLTLTYNYLEMLVSRITCGGKLTFKAEKQSLVYNGNIASVPGQTKMISRNSSNCHVIAKKDISASLGSGDISSSFTGSNIFVDAFNLAWRGAGNQIRQSTQMINLSDQRTDPLPIAIKVAPPKTMVAIGEVKDAIAIEQEIERVREAFERNYYTIYRGVEGLGLNPDQLFNSVFNEINQHVRGLKGTKSQIVPITWDGKKTEVEVLTNKKLTKQNLLDLNKLSAFIELFAQNINALESEQKANAVVQGIFPASQIIDGGHSQGDIGILSQYDVDISTDLKAEENIRGVSFEGNLTLSSQKQRHYWGDRDENYYETLDSKTVDAGKNLYLYGQNLGFNSANTKSGEETKFETPGNIVDAPIPLHSQRFSYHLGGYTHDKWTHQMPSTHQSGGGITSTAEGKQELYAPNFIAEKPILISGNKGANIYEVHDTHDQESHTTKDGGFFGGSKTSHSQSSSSTSKGANLKSDEVVKIVSGTDIKSINTSFDAPKVRLEAIDGIVKLLLGTNHHYSSTVDSGSSAFWQSQSVSQKEDKTFSTPKIKGKIEIYSKETILEQVRGQALEYADRIDQHGGEVITKILDEIHFNHSESKQGVSIGGSSALAAVMAIVITVATSGTGTSLGASLAAKMGQATLTTTGSVATITTTGSIIQGMTSAALTSLCSTSGVALLQARGNVSEALKSLTSGENLKSLGIATLSGGISGYMGNPTGFMQDLKSRLTQNTIGAGLNKVIKNENLEKGLVSGVITSAIGATMKVGASQIGDLKSEIDPITHKAMHTGLGTLTGALTGAITQKDIKKSALSGGVGSLVCETVAEIADSKAIGDVIATLAAFSLNLDPTIAYTASDNSTTNNFEAHKTQEKEEETTEYNEEQQAFERGRARFVNDSLECGRKARGRELRKSSYEKIIENANEFYYKFYGSSKVLSTTGNLIGKGIVTTSEMLPGMQGVNQAWMGLVNHVRGDLPEGALQNEVLGGLQSSINDVALGMATFGAFKVVSGGIKVARKAKGAFQQVQKDPRLAGWKKKPKVEASLDWSIKHPKTTKGDTAHHVRTRHEHLSLSKADQGVFYGDSVKTVEEVWKKAQLQGIKPSVIKEKDVYIVPRANSGYSGGIGGQRTNYDYVTIVTKKDSNQIITAYPSGATPEFPKEYAWLFEGNK